MSRRRGTFVQIKVYCRVCGAEFGRYGRRTSGPPGGASWLHKATGAVIDDVGPHGERFTFRCAGTDDQGCNAAPQVRADRLNAGLDELVKQDGPRASGVLYL